MDERELPATWTFVAKGRWSRLHKAIYVALGADESVTVADDGGGWQQMLFLFFLLPLRSRHHGAQHKNTQTIMNGTNYSLPTINVHDKTNQSVKSVQLPNVGVGYGSEAGQRRRKHGDEQQIVKEKRDTQPNKKPKVICESIMI